MTLPVKIFDNQTEDGSSLVFRVSTKVADQRGVKVSMHGTGGLGGGTVQFHGGVNDVIADHADIADLSFTATFVKEMTLVPGMVYAATLSLSTAPTFTLEITGLVEATVGVPPPPVETISVLLQNNSVVPVPLVVLLEDGAPIVVTRTVLLENNDPIVVT